MLKKKSEQFDGSVDTLIGPQVVIRGDLEFSGGLHVEGRIIGKVIATDGGKAMLTLAEGGVIEGEVHAPIVALNGSLTGDVHASERVELAPKARVRGNIHYKVVEMCAGATLTGRLIHVDSLPAEHVVEGGREALVEAA